MPVLHMEMHNRVQKGEGEYREAKFDIAWVPKEYEEYKGEGTLTSKANFSGWILPKTV